MAEGEPKNLEEFYTQQYAKEDAAAAAAIVEQQNIHLSKAVGLGGGVYENEIMGDDLRQSAENETPLAAQVEAPSVNAVQVETLARETLPEASSAEVTTRSQAEALSDDASSEDASGQDAVEVPTTNEAATEVEPPTAERTRELVASNEASVNAPNVLAEELQTLFDKHNVDSRARQALDRVLSTTTGQEWAAGLPDVLTLDPREKIQAQVDAVVIAYEQLNIDRRNGTLDPVAYEFAVKKLQAENGIKTDITEWSFAKSAELRIEPGQQQERRRSSQTETLIEASTRYQQTRESRLIAQNLARTNFRENQDKLLAEQGTGRAAFLILEQQTQLMEMIEDLRQQEQHALQDMLRTGNYSKEERDQIDQMIQAEQGARQAPTVEQTPVDVLCSDERIRSVVDQLVENARLDPKWENGKYPKYLAEQLGLHERMYPIQPDPEGKGGQQYILAENSPVRTALAHAETVQQLDQLVRQQLAEGADPSLMFETIQQLIASRHIESMNNTDIQASIFQAHTEQQRDRATATRNEAQATQVNQLAQQNRRRFGTPFRNFVARTTDALRTSIGRSNQTTGQEQTMNAESTQSTDLLASQTAEYRADLTDVVGPARVGRLNDQEIKSLWDLLSRSTSQPQTTNA